VYNLVKKQYNYPGTYQSIYKSIQQLAEEGVLERRKNEYLINTNWIKRIKDFSETIEKEYTQSMAENRNKKTSPSNGMIKIMSINSVREFDNYYINMRNIIVSKITSLPKEERVVFLHLPHCYFALVYPKAELQFINMLKKTSTRVYYLVHGETTVDKWLQHFYKDSPLQVVLGTECSIIPEKLIGSEEVLDVYFNSTFLERFNALYSQVKEIKDIESGKFHYEFTKFLESSDNPGPEPIQLVINYNPVIVKSMRELSSKILAEKGIILSEG